MYGKTRLEGDDDGERLVSCKGWKGVFGGSGGEMVYLEPHADGSYTSHVIAKVVYLF